MAAKVYISMELLTPLAYFVNSLKFAIDIFLFITPCYES